MEDFCGSKLWDTQLTWDTTDPYFTPCFEKLVLLISPVVFVFIFGFIDIINFSKSKFRSPTLLSSFTRLVIIKTLLSTLLICIQLTETIQVLLLDSKIYTVDYLSPALLALGYVVILFLCIASSSRNVCSSGVQFFFWLGVLITQAILFRTALRYYDSPEETGDKEQFVFLMRLISFPMCALRFILEWFNEGDRLASKNSKVKLGKPNAEKTSSYISKLLILWYDKLAWKGYRRTLTSEDLWDLNPEDTSRAQSEKFNKFWEKEQTKTSKQSKEKQEKLTTGIFWPLTKSYGITYGFSLISKLAADSLVFVQPEMLSLLVTHVQNPDLDPVWKGYAYAAVLCVTAIVQSVLNANSYKRALLVGMRVRTAISNAVFKKALVISSASKKESSVGEVVNLMSVDTQKIMEFLTYFYVSVGSPLQFIVALVLLYGKLGPSIFAGVGLLILLIPINMWLVSMSRVYQTEQMKLKDERLKLTTEVMGGIKVLKLYAWEPAYKDQIEAIRQKELICLRKIAIVNAVMGAIFQSTPVFVSLVSFLTYVLSDPANVLNAEKTFVSLSLFNIIRFPMIYLPITFSVGMQASVSVKRLNKYLNMEELDKNAVTHDDSYEDPIVIKDGSFSWTEDNVTLRNINFSIKKGELVAIVGTIGSGKSSLLSALLGDISKHSGVVNINGQLAYVSQSAWIQNATLRDNILFGDKFNQSRYAKTVKVCALETDLQMLSSGDQTEIGEKGINLSGGQKQRVALARAAYKEASIYLFDDPLSAVDAHVGKHIFDGLLGPNGMLSDKTRVLVTHGIGFLPKVDRIIVMKNGQISETGTYKQLLMKQGEFAEFLITHLGIEDDEDLDPDRMSLIQDLEEVIGAETEQRRSSTRESIVRILKRFPSRSEKLEATPKKEPEPEQSNKLIEDELSAEGNIDMSVFINFLKSAGYMLSICAVFFFMASNGLIAFSNIWLSNWSTQATLDEIETNSSKRSTTDKYLVGYGLIGAAQGVASISAGCSLAMACLAASRVLHSEALYKVIRAPMSYFDTTLMGRLINRFSKDVDVVDNIVPLNVRVFLFMLFNVLCSFIIISYTSPLFIAFIVPMTIFYFFLQRFYVTTSRQLKRLEGTTRSPIYSHFGETVSGSSIVRAFRLEDEFMLESEKRVDLNQKAYFPFLYSGLWLAIRLEFIGALIILSTCIFTLMSRKSIDPGAAGLAISYGLQISSLLNLLARQMSELEANIVSAERVAELNNTPQEPAWEKPYSQPRKTWPEQGEVKFEKYMTRYREGLELVLRGISCTFKAGEKIGVVGRTGAGKSSLTLALFRIIESASGKIFIDGVDVSTLGLHDLRKKITIIPQDPILFSGNIRLNLDPFNHYSDDEVWRCLELAHLKSYVSTLKEGLSYRVEEEGQNFSIGQRQLICLARALLRKTRILVLDEATAAVDLETDALIQATIRKEFADCTVITIAHRLNTIMDSNRVLVLDKGEIKEFDSPQNLLEDSSTIFWGMAHDAKIV